MPSEFSLQVIAAVRKIPRGKVATYAQIAALAGKAHASRGVSWILHSSAEAHKLPWHRVINSQGKISFPKTSPSFRSQMRLLRAEKVPVQGDGSIALGKFQWKKTAPRPKRGTPRMFS